MPQMMPLNWIFSLFFFISIFILFNIMNYFSFKMNNYNFFNKKFFKKSFNLKW